MTISLDQPKTLQALPADSLQAEANRVIETALAEDLGITPEEVAKLAGTGKLTEFDVTTTATVPFDKVACAEFVLKQPGVICGLNIAEQVFATLDPSIKFESLASDGQVFEAQPVVIARVSGPVRTLLVAERTALNLLQKLCGVATSTREYTKHASKHGIKILDTRKTTPGMRLLEKYAVRSAGGTNHRIGLFDAVLIKDNHVSIAGGVTAAIANSRARFPQMPVEVEVTNEAELREALAAKAEKVLLDNMTPQQVRNAVALVAKQAFIEVSGGINLTNLETYLIDGIDAISVGALTHSVRSLDISLEIGG